MAFDGEFSIQLDSTRYSAVLAQYTKVLPQAIDHALAVVARELLIDAKMHVPVLTGALKSSGRVEDMPDFDAAVRTVRVVFGDPFLIRYAAIQHEKPYWHPSLGFYGAAKFLEKPLEQNAVFYLELMRVEVERFIQRALS